MGRVNRQFGFSLAEVMIVLIFTGVLVVATYPSLIKSANGGLSLTKTKNMAAQIQSAVLNYLNDPVANPDGSISGLTELRTALNSNLNFTTYTDGSIDSTSCSSNCLKFPDGSMLLAANMASWGQILYDPDGPGPVEAVMLLVDINTGRITTVGANANDPTQDPTYVWGWMQY